MAYEEFDQDYHPQKKTVKLINQINEIVNEYSLQGYKLSERQTHYQLVAKNLRENTDSNYGSLTRTCTNARMAGLVDWNAIVDRNRETHRVYHNKNIQQALSSALLCYGRDKMEKQKVYIEIMIEKMALFDIVSQVADKYTLRLTGDKGFCSVTILYEIAGRIKEEQKLGKKCYILYIGDHDPSGLAMDVSIISTLAKMGANGVDFRRVALTPEQVKEYNLPPNMIKESNTNSPKYKEKHGEFSWECDALPPEILNEVLENSILSIIDYSKYQEMCKLEEAEKEKLRQIIDSIEMTSSYGVA
ncbi:hypothetical protein [Methanosarcina mazei]|uniref:DUF2399 domain-containing protein n=2 Tax=Methanosarcina mazei TaxID=2209 RepID=A0A6C0VK49_METMZ|nr:hypothetical protein [Methanosarcina mazei]AKB61367.1 hypothetical protein MSMAP_1382 [Methanosarcina mazei SarPi]QIB90984.1 hypothetical protein FQU78_07890 [Methanosarcina mazei]